MEELQLKLTKANENVSCLQKSIGDVTLKAEQSQQEATKKHEEEKKDLLHKLQDLVRRREHMGLFAGEEGEGQFSGGEVTHSFSLGSPAGKEGGNEPQPVSRSESQV